jgi:hypothetical protein
MDGAGREIQAEPGEEPDCLTPGRSVAADIGARWRHPPLKQAHSLEEIETVRRLDERLR